MAEDIKVNLDKKKSLLMWTILIIAFVQMPGLALTPAINSIQTQAFPNKTLADVQTALAWTNLVSPLTSIIAAFFINKRLVTKKSVVVAGLLILALTGLLAVFLHLQFWHLILLSVVLGMATGCFMTNAFGLLFDNFEDKQRQVIAGFQTSAINAGGISMGLLGGLLATQMWYGGYFILLIGLPIAILAYFTVPSYKSPAVMKTISEKKKLNLKNIIEAVVAYVKRFNPRIFYYALLACIFMMIYGVSGGNISTHIKQNIPNVDGAAMSGIAVAIQMGGGVISGIFFGRISKKLGDMILVVACAAVFTGFMILSLFASSLIMIFIGVFITGFSLSMMLPRCTFAVSALVDKSTSATATVVALSIAPSLGGFLSPQVFTRLTLALGGNATVFRYIFVACFALVFGAIIAIITLNRAKKQKITA